MVFPVYFALGAAVGSVSTYLYKDKAARQKLVATGNKVKQGVKSGTSRVTGVFKKTPKAEAEVVTTEEVHHEEAVPQSA